MNEKIILHCITQTLVEKKAEAIKTIDVTKLTDISDFFVICTASSTRHAKALLGYVVEAVKKRLNLNPYGVEGEEQGEWILIDFLSVVVHIMLPETRQFYDLESLWRVTKNSRIQEKTTTTE